MQAVVRRPKSLRGSITPPGDKSISHRAAIFNAIALLDGELVAAAAGHDAALLALLERAAPEGGALVTLYVGSGLDLDAAQATADTITSRFDGVDVEVHEGGQPHYQYLVSIE